MKKYISILAVIAIITVMVSCERTPDVPEITHVDESMILTIADIYKIHTDSGDNYEFKDDYMLFGTITMDDGTDNIYKEAYIQDETGGINLYKLGSAGLVKTGERVRINLKGGQIINYSGKMEISFVNVEDFSLQVILQETNVPIEPIEVTMAEILDTPEYFDCRLVKLIDVQVAASDTALTYAIEHGSSTQSRNLETCNGDKLVMRNSDYSDFAGDTLPNGSGSIIGIMTRYIKKNTSGTTTTYQIIIRTPDEVNLTDSRCPNL